MTRPTSWPTCSRRRRSSASCRRSTSTPATSSTNTTAATTPRSRRGDGVRQALRRAEQHRAGPTRRGRQSRIAAAAGSRRGRHSASDVPIPQLRVGAKACPRAAAAVNAVLRSDRRRPPVTMSAASLLRRGCRDRGAARGRARGPPGGVRAAHRRRQEGGGAVRTMDKETRNAIERPPRRRDGCSRRSSPSSSTARSTSARLARRREPRRTPRRAERCARSWSRRRPSSSLRARRRDAVAAYLRDAAFTTLNRFVALKMLEARELVQECVSQGEQSSGLRGVLRPGARRGAAAGRRGYRLYLECLFDELATEVKVLFDRRDPASASVAAARGAAASSWTSSTHPELAAVWARTRRSAGSTSTSTARRAQADARREPGTAQQPRARRPQPVLHAALRRPSS